MRLPDIVSLLRVCQRLMPLLELAEEEGCDIAHADKWTPEQVMRVNRRIGNDPRLTSLISDNEVIAFMQRFEEGGFDR